VPVQVRFAIDLTSDEYVSRNAWREASLPTCPVHPGGGCGIQRHGTYRRVEPPGTQIARWYCRKGGVTVSLLPDCLAAGVSGSLQAIEDAVATADAAASQEIAAEALRPDIELPGALRWLRRRRACVGAVLRVMRGLWPERLAGASTLGACRAALGTDAALVAVRARAAAQHRSLPRPVGFGDPAGRGDRNRRRAQHEAGPDPPPGGGDPSCNDAAHGARRDQGDQDR
jgi:hypothetical protein